ncbi:MAG: GNAT family N-acetyltransferase [Planctomycetota bacterium]
MDATGDIVAGGQFRANMAEGEASEGGHLPLVSRVDSCMTIREGTLDDLAWMDQLQKAERAALGFLPWTALREKVERNEVLVADVIGKPAGYLIASDRYQKRDELGLITQMNVDPLYRGHLVAAALLQAQFDRSAYGCKLYSCWCAQDLEANRFWESMGFVAIAFRSGKVEVKARKSVAPHPCGGLGPDAEHGKDAVAPEETSEVRTRVHLFWQKRIRPGDTGVGATAWWYPAKTDGGQLRADRIALPIPPGTHWRDVEAVAVPEVEVEVEMETSPDREGGESAPEDDAEHELKFVPRKKWPTGIEERDGKVYRGDKRLMTIAMIKAEQGAAENGMWYMPEGVEVVKEMPEPEIIKPKAKRPRSKRVKQTPAKTVDPAFVAWSRELRDRWLEEVELEPTLLMAANPKYDVRRSAKRSMRQLTGERPMSMKALPAYRQAA